MESLCGIINGAIHANKPGGFWKGFAIGAVAGGIGAATGGAAFLAAGGSATVAGAGGFVAGLASGAAGAAAQNVALGVGNFLGYDEKYDPKSFVRDVAFGGLFGGVVNGGLAAFKGKNFWNGDPKAVSAKSAFSFNNTDKLVDEGWNRTESGKWGRIGNDNAIYRPVEKQLADGSTAWSDNFAGHKTGDVYGGQSSWIEGTNKSSLNTMIEGRYAVESVTGNSTRNFSTVRDQINTIGRRYGCHTCGTKTSNGTYIPDHQPSLKLNPNGPFKLFPHCPSCSKLQGGQVNKFLNH